MSALMSGLVSVCTGTGPDALLPRSTSSPRTQPGKSFLAVVLLSAN